ncbi:MAG: DJ-1/PfpI family protein [Burkholderiales bacterium]|nr:DJ-1/PfpI family protein [Burkholderiales bacterium]
MRFGILLYDGVEPIDLATYGVLSMARRIAPQIEICSIARSAGPVALSNGLTVLADHGHADAPPLDALIVTGGPGWMAEREHPGTRSFLASLPARTLVASVCTGAMLLASAGLLDGRAATTKQQVTGGEVPPIDILAREHPSTQVSAATWIDAGGVVTGGGVSLCIDTTLHLLDRLLGPTVAAETARIIEYGAALEANARRLPPVTNPPR